MSSLVLALLAFAPAQGAPAIRIVPPEEREILRPMALPRSEPRGPGSGPDDERWLAGAGERLAALEYEFSPVEGGTWSAPNRASGLRSRVDERGLEVFPRTTPAQGEEPPWRLRIGARSIGEPGREVPLQPGRPRAMGARMEIDRGELVEWIENEPTGIEQGWTVAAQPFERPTRFLWIGLDVEGDLRMEIASDGRSAKLFDEAGELTLRYRGLEAFDANGDELDARMMPSPDGLGIRVDVGRAPYPITIDPIVGSPEDLLASPLGPDGRFGWTVVGAGDLNGDGFSDVAVGAPFWDFGGSEDGGVVALFLGSAGGISGTADVVWPNVDPGSRFGWALAAIGDLDGDGLDDLAIGAPGADVDRGQVFLVLGSTTGLSSSGPWIEGGAPGLGVGIALDGAGDVDGDSRRDLVGGLGAIHGGAFVYGLDSGGFPQLWNASSGIDFTEFGKEVAGGCDLDGDGFDDIAIGAAHPKSGGDNRVWVWYGEAGFFGSPAGTALNVDWVADGEQPWDEFSTALAMPGDLDGDGYADLVVGAPSYEVGGQVKGRAYAWFGGPGGLGPNGTHLNADWTSAGDPLVEDGYFASRLSSAGDVNSDGFADFVVGAPGYDAGGTSNAGAAYLYLGSVTGPGTSPVFVRHGSSPGEALGTSVSSAGDVDGDGFADLVIGAPDSLAPVGARTGSASVFYGCAEYPEVPHSIERTGGSFNAFLGASCGNAGDVNGDGFEDLIVGAPYFDGGVPGEGMAMVVHGGPGGVPALPDWTARSFFPNASLGTSVSGAGDFDGDGYGDVVVGVPGFTNDGQSGEGSVWMWFGSPTGLGADGTPGNVDWATLSGQTGAHLGTSVASAGDVNGDGLGDIIVGAPDYELGPETNEGVANVYLGRTDRAVVGWSSLFQSNQPQARLGASVASAGDVDGDGYDDVIVGAPDWTNGENDEGAAFLWYGGVNGPVTFGTPANADWSDEVDQANAKYGTSVSGGGDLNGDGFDEIAIGAPFWDDTVQGTTNEGLVRILFGSGGGPVNPADAFFGVDGAKLGTDVSHYGDMNGDGYDELCFGAEEWDLSGTLEAGVAGIVVGDPAGVSLALVISGTQAGEYYGSSVAGVDLDGDGLRDLVVGARSYDTTFGRDGRVAVHLANAGGGAAYAPRQIRTDFAGPVSTKGRSDSADGLYPLFSVATASGTTGTAVGACRIGAELDMVENGQPFDGSDYPVALQFEADPSIFGLGIYQQDTGRSPHTDLRWRWRLNTEHPFFPRTRWFSLPVDSRAGAMGRVGPDCDGDLHEDRDATLLGLVPDADMDGLPDSCEPADYGSPKVDSLGCAPLIGTAGTPTLAGPDDFHVLAINAPGQTSGVLLISFAANPPGGPGLGSAFGGSPLGAQFFVYEPVSAGQQTSTGTPGICDGTFDFFFEQDHMQKIGLTTPQDVFVQWIYGDPGDPNGIGHTGALTVPVGP